MAQRDRISRGDVALGLIWSDVAWDLVSSDEFVNRQTFGFAPIPGDVSMLAGGSYYINKKSKHPRAAMAMILDQLELSNQVELTSNGLCSALRPVYEEQALLDRVPYAEALEKSLDRGVYMLEAGPDADAIIEGVSDAIQRLVRSPDLDTQEVLSATEAEIAAQRRRIYDHLGKAE